MMKNQSTNSCICTLFGHKGYIWAVNVTLNSKFLFSGSGDASIKMWYTEKKKVIRTFIGHTDYVLTLAISQNIKYIV